MTLAALERAGDSEEVVDGGGLLGGLTAYHLRVLCESGWNGGAGYTPEQVGRMTLDQIWFRLCDMNVLKREVGERTDEVSVTAAMGSLKPDRRGRVRGRAADGTPIRRRLGGKSVARQLMEREVRREKKERRKRKGG